MTFLGFMTKVKHNNENNNENETKSDIFHFNDCKNWNFSGFWLKWTQTIKKKQNQIFFPWDTFKSDTISFFIKKILKYFNDFQNLHFSVLWLKWTQTMELKQNQTFFYGIYSNLTLLFIGHKILKYFTDFCNLDFSISLQK